MNSQGHRNARAPAFAFALELRNMNTNCSVDFGSRERGLFAGNLKPAAILPRKFATRAEPVRCTIGKTGGPDHATSAQTAGAETVPQPASERQQSFHDVARGVFFPEGEHSRGLADAMRHARPLKRPPKGRPVRRQNADVPRPEVLRRNRWRGRAPAGRHDAFVWHGADTA